MKGNHLAIIGGGPIGLGLALFLAKRGYCVDIYEQGQYPRDKACGQGIMPKGQRILLEDLQVELGEDFYSFSGIDYIDEHRELSGRFRHKALGIERRVLSAALYEKVSDNSLITLYENTKVNDLVFTGDYVIVEAQGYKIEYQYAFACDGVNSPLRRKFDMQVERAHPWRQGARVHFDQAPWSDHVQVYWNNGIEAYVTPVSKKRIEVAFLWYEDTSNHNPPRVQGKLIDQLFSYFPGLVEKLDHNKMRDDFKGSATFSHIAKTSHYKKLFFVGDSYGFLDGITGEGISLGLAQAKYVAIHFHHWNILHNSIYRLKYIHYWIMVNVALSLSRHIRWRRFLFRRLNSKIFSWILKLNDL